MNSDIFNILLLVIDTTYDYTPDLLNLTQILILINMLYPFSLYKSSIVRPSSLYSRDIYSNYLHSFIFIDIYLSPYSLLRLKVQNS